MNKYIASLLLISATLSTAFAQVPPQVSVDQIMKWDAESVAFDTVARRHFKLVENKLDARVAKLIFKSADQTCEVTLNYVGALPNPSEAKPKLELPKGWMLSAYQCSVAQPHQTN